MNESNLLNKNAEGAPPKGLHSQPNYIKDIALLNEQKVDNSSISKSSLSSGFVPYAFDGAFSGKVSDVAKQKAGFALCKVSDASLPFAANHCALFGLRPTSGKLDLTSHNEFKKCFDRVELVTESLILMQKIFNAQHKKIKGWGSAKRIYLDRTLAAHISESCLTRLSSTCKAAGINLLYTDVLADKGLNLEVMSLILNVIEGYQVAQKSNPSINQLGPPIGNSLIHQEISVSDISADEYLLAKKNQLYFTQQLHNVLEQQDGQWLVPSTPSSSFQFNSSESLDNYRKCMVGLNSISALSGFPQLHLPLCDEHNESYGVSLLGLPDSENSLFSTAKSLLNQW